MAIIPFELTWMYQANEEILETRFEFIADETIEADTSQLICEDLADWAYLQRGSLAAILPTDCIVWGVSARSPNWFGAGPARCDRHCKVAGTYSGVSLTDQITYRIYQTAHNSLAKPIKNSCEMSGLPVSAVDCNLISQDFIDAVTDEIPTLMPLTLALSAANLTLAVRNKIGAADPVWYPAESVYVADMVGSNITRRGNRSQRGPDTKPDVP